MKSKGLMFLILWFTGIAWGDPAGSNVTVARRPGAKCLEIGYDLSEDAARVSLGVSGDGETARVVSVQTLLGYVGLHVPGGIGRRILWDADLKLGETAVPLKIQVSASPDNLVHIPARVYQRGNVTCDSDITDAPVQRIRVSEFYVQPDLVTKAQWDEVRLWGGARGYTDLAAGGGKGNKHPVQAVNWYNGIKWCNAASERAGLVPCYRVEGKVYREGISDAVVCDWSANGYRLPTELEWEVAARGGMAATRFPWGDIITHSEANYRSSLLCRYEETPTRGYHPAYAVEGRPFTSPVGSFASNGYGLNDMGGNLFQWCWDWYGDYSELDDTRGAPHGSSRILRGGSWNGHAGLVRSAFRSRSTPDVAYDFIGLRLVRGSVSSESSGVVRIEASVLVFPTEQNRR